MNTIFRIGKTLLGKLRNRRYRHSYMSEHVRRGIAYQIRALRDQLGWSQGAFACELGKPQSVVSRLEDPKYGKVTVQTLLEVASAFDVALQVRFVSYSQFLRDNQDRTSVAMLVPSFADDAALDRGQLIVSPTDNDRSKSIWLGDSNIVTSTKPAGLELVPA